MAEEEEYDDGVYFDDDYFYVEDSYDRTDELAETSVPSPPPIDTIEERYVTYDPYDYWLDIEYGTDEYYDVLLRAKAGEGPNSTGAKRKAAMQDQADNKRRRIGRADNIDAETGQERIYTGPNVIHMPARQLWSLKEPCKACGKLKPYAVLPDWQKVLASATTRSVPELEAPADVEENEADEDWADEDEAGSSSSVADSRHDSAQALDLGQLMEILQQQTGGGKGADIQQMLLQMLAEAGEDMDMEQILEQLTAKVLDQVKDSGSDSSMGQWLAGQGVQFDDEASEAGTNGDETDKPKSSTAANADSAAEGGPTASQSSKTAKKRKGQGMDEDRAVKQARTEADNDVQQAASRPKRALRSRK